MEIEKTREESKLVIKLKGRLDTTSAPDLEKEIAEGVDGVTELVIDMHELDYISSAGLRVLLKAQRVMNDNGRMIVTGAGPVILEIFEVTGFADILTIE
ncbi:MAG: STAS domain-containing protein [Clostridiales bacterium]|nr:STAS domain-containing protein [Clostridiales bacterium]